jgi:hypothetical protein
MKRAYCTQACATAALLLPLACGKSTGDVALSKADDDAPLDVPVPAADGPRLGSIAHTTPVRARPSKESKILGYLHAGAKVARAEEPYSEDGCKGGWYPVRPRGFVCLEEGATLDPHHPTLVTMAIQPNLAEALPYAYARTTADAPVYEVDESRERGIKTTETMPSMSGLAVVGSWEATDEQGATHKLAMMTNGRFVDADKLKQAPVSTFVGVELNAEVQLPVGFVVKRGVNTWKLDGAIAEKQRELDVHTRLSLSGKFRTVEGHKYWELTDGAWVRHQDITTARKREDAPPFVTETRRWVDISVVTGTAVAYEGKTPVYATLVSVGKDRLGTDLEQGEITERGEFEVIAKHTTALNANIKGFANRVDIYDTPWTLELASGQLMHGAYWHERYGVEHGPGHIQLSPADARWFYQWATPDVPEGWHAVTLVPDDVERTIINVRK